jgi:hypothetical protein
MVSITIALPQPLLNKKFHGQLCQGNHISKHGLGAVVIEQLPLKIYLPGRLDFFCDSGGRLD